jgi:hypothetical protein
MEDNRYAFVDKDQLVQTLKTVIADDWRSRELAELLLSELPTIDGNDCGPWLLRQLDEFDLLLSALRIRYFGYAPMFKGIGLTIAKTKRE